MVHPLLALSSLSCVITMRMNGAPVVGFEQLSCLRKKTVMSCAGQVHDHIAVFGPR